MPGAVNDLYEYAQGGHVRVRITEDLHSVCVETPAARCGHLPAAERQAAAQALAGSEWQVVSANQRAPLPTIDPADVKVGDVVEVEADDGSWLVRGPVATTDDTPSRKIGLTVWGGLWLAPFLDHATVRPVRREPDPGTQHTLARKPPGGGGGHTPGVGWMCTGCDWRFSYDMPETRARAAWLADARHNPNTAQEVQ